MREKSKNQSGITLVALIITIIILIIIAAVTIRALTHDKLAETAIKGAQNYQGAQTSELEKLQELDEKLKETVKDLENAGQKDKGDGTIPNIDEVIVNRTAEGMSLDVIGTAAEGNIIDYTVEYGTSTNYGKTATGSGIMSQMVNIQLEGIMETETVYWKVNIDGNPASTLEGVSSHCTDATSTTTACSSCGGIGKTPTSNLVYTTGNYQDYYGVCYSTGSAVHRFKLNTGETATCVVCGKSLGQYSARKIGICQTYWNSGWFDLHTDMSDTKPPLLGPLCAVDAEEVWSTFVGSELHKKLQKLAQVPQFDTCTVCMGSRIHTTNTECEHGSTTAHYVDKRT